MTALKKCIYSLVMNRGDITCIFSSPGYGKEPEIFVAEVRP